MPTVELNDSEHALMREAVDASRGAGTKTQEALETFKRVQQEALDLAHKLEATAYAVLKLRGLDPSFHTLQEIEGRLSFAFTPPEATPEAVPLPADPTLN